MLKPRLYHPDFFGAFDSLKTPPKQVNIVAWDSEDDTYGRPMSFAFYDGGKVLKKKFFYTTSAEEAERFIYQYPVESYFISHNLEYDLANLSKHSNFLFVDEIIKAPLMLKVTLQGCKHVMLNSMSYFKGSVEKMGKLVGLEKLKGEKRSQLNPEYVIQDARIVWEYMRGFQDRLVRDFGVSLGLSIGAISMSVYRSRFMDCNRQATYNNPLCLNAYYGGRVEVFSRGLIKGPVFDCDIKSSYPNAMKKFIYPDTGLLEKSRIKTHEFGIGHFQIHVPKDTYVPILPYKSPESGRLYFPVGDLEGWWTYAEVRAAVAIGAKILKEVDGVGTNTGVRPFEKFVDFFYDLREVCKDRLTASNDEDLDAASESQLLKDIMNNNYGKWCQHKTKSRFSRRPIPDAFLKETLGEYEEKQVGPFFEYVQKNSKPPRTANFMWGLYVTSYARLELHKHMLAVRNAGGTLLYCDTDSVMFTGEDALKSLPISNKLGDLGVSKYDMGIFRQAKGYLLCNKNPKGDFIIKKVACKGVATSHAYEFIVEGAATSLKPMRFKEALVRTNAKKNKGKLLTNVGFNVWRDVPKAMRAIDIKRTAGEGPTFPIDIKEIPDLEDNATCEAEDWTGKIKESPIYREAREEYFRGVTPPEGWYRETGLPEEIGIAEDSLMLGAVPKRFYIRRLDLKAVKPGNIWFSGDVIKAVTFNDRKCVEIVLGAYLGQFLNHRLLTAYLPLATLKILECNEKRILGKRIVVSKDEDDELTIEVFNKQNKKVRLAKPNLKAEEKASQAEKNRRMMEFLNKRGKIISETDFFKPKK